MKITFALFCNKALVIAFPIPLAPPVTTATQPSNFMIESSNCEGPIHQDLYRSMLKQQGRTKIAYHISLQVF